MTTPAAVAATLPRRYPGLKPFERSQRAVFHGRRDDIQRLSNLILRERLVVMFAKSGVGKTSLLQAGVGPELERQDYAPVFLRADRTDVSILDGFSSVLANNASVSGRDTTGERPGEPQTLWEQVKRLEFDLNGLPATPVLVFDQFEEVFTLGHSDSSRMQFINALAELANETMPGGLRSDLLLKFQEGSIDVATMQWWEKQPDLRIVLSIRSDFLHLLDNVSTRIPGILRNRYQLQPLDREKARMAIVQPAQSEGEFLSPPFLYSEVALAEMVDFLSGNEGAVGEQDANTSAVSRQRDEIETVNLQIVCQDIEEAIIDSQQKAGFTVEPDFYSGQAGLKRSIRNFYDNQLQAFPKAYTERIAQRTNRGVPVSPVDIALLRQSPDVLRDTAQRLIEESLVTTGNRRNSVVDDTLLDNYQVSPEFLDTLVDKSRLLRKEPRLDDFYYEIGHDTLLPAIIESRNKRREEERYAQERMDYEARLQAEAQQRDEMGRQLALAQRQRQLARRVATTSIITAAVAIVALIISGVFLKDYVKSTRAQLRQAEENVHNELFEAAIRGYAELGASESRKRLLRYLPPRCNVEAELQQVLHLNTHFDTLALLMHTGDSLTVKQDYAGALHAFRAVEQAIGRYQQANTTSGRPTQLDSDGRVSAKRIQERSTDVDRRVRSTMEVLVSDFEVSQRDFEVFKEAKIWGQAYRTLKDMQALLPKDSADLKQMQDEINLSESPADFVARELAACAHYLGR